MKIFIPLLFLILLSEVKSAYIYNDKLILKNYAKIYKNEKKTALIIGNAHYNFFNNLKTPINNAKDISSALKKLGFDIIYLTDGKKEDMREAIRKFYDILKKKKGIGLFYYSGHGIEINNKNFLIPIDAKIKKRFEIATECINLAYVTASMSSAENRGNIIILDASRRLPKNITDEGFVPIDNADGIYIAYATAPNKKAIEKEGERNSLFTKHILSLLKVQGIKIDDLFNEVRQRVYKESDGKQLPFVSTGFLGTFYFNIPSNLLSEPLKDNEKIDFNQYGEPIIEPQRGKIIPKIGARIKKYLLNIKTIPKDAKIYFINRDIEYRPNMYLKEGNYELFISREGYISKKGDIPLHEDVDIVVTLSKENNFYNSYKVKNENREKKVVPKVKKRKKRVEKFNVQSKLVWIDKKSNLMWEKKTEANKEDEFNWKEAKEYCNSLILGKYRDWRLPTKKELLSIIDKRKYNTFYIKKPLSKPMGEWGWYWSSTSLNKNEAMVVYFTDRKSRKYEKEGKYYVRCVRNK